MFGYVQEVLGWDEAFKEAVNQEFNALSDTVLLRQTKPYFYWWEPDFLRGTAADELPRFAKNFIHNHFMEYYNTVSGIPFPVVRVHEPFA